MGETTWNLIIEAPIDQLPDIEKILIVQAKGNEGEAVEKLFYTRILMAYFRNNAQVIKTLMEEHQDLLERQPGLKILSLMRFHLRTTNFSLPDIIELKSQIFRLEHAQSFCLAEACFISATASQVMKEFKRAQDFYTEAAAYYEKNGFKKKSLRAQLSALAAYSCLYPESRLFQEYNLLYQKSVAIGEVLTAGTALLNISREFQRLKALPHALDAVENAVALLEDHHRGSRELGLAIAHRVHLLFQMDRRIEAENDVIYALCNPHPEVQAACGVLAKAFNLDLETLSAKSLLATWEERQTESASSETLAPMESLLVKLLSETSLSKYELMDALFGDKISFESKDNRLKNLLSRVRSKLPGVLVLKDGLYLIQDKFSLKGPLK